ncbi:MAG TPA: LytR C-terminal domain-containing protein [Acidimicrobiales bacterium]|nr:LytR C-terminal domain-containing protein [Acidimicrobiales bacterium]
MSDPTSSSRDGHASGSHYQPSLSVVLIIVVLFVGATFLMVRAVSPSSASPTTTTTAPSSTSTTRPPAGRVIKSKVRVQVANGTTISSLAARYTQKLQTQNWDTLPPVNGPHVAATIIYYNPTERAAALEVATVVGVSASVVHPLGGLLPVSGASGDGVIVILGPNSGG